MFFYHSGSDADHHETAGRVAFTAAFSDKQLAARVGMRHICATCGHVSQHPDPDQLRQLARAHYADKHQVAA